MLGQTDQDDAVALEARSPPSRWIGHGADLAVIMSALLMVILYNWQRQDAVEQMRRTTTVGIMQLRYSDRILSAEAGLNEFVTKNFAFYEKTELATPSQSPPSFELPANARSDFVLMIDFYTDILACLDSELCERALVGQWFEEDMCQFTKLGEIIGFPQIREQFGDEMLARLTQFRKEECLALQ
jgi:hypothetical protein